MKAYSTDLRQRIVSAVIDGMSKAEAARTYKVSLSTVKRLVDLYEVDPNLAAGVSPGRTRLIKNEQETDLLELVDATPDARLIDHVQAWEEKHGVRVSYKTISRVLKRCKYTKKKDFRGKRAG